MSIKLNRRRLMQVGSSALMMGAFNPFLFRASAQSAGEVRVALYGGDVGKAGIEALVKPFEAETGIKVVPVTDDVSLTAVELMVTNGNVSIDVAPFGAADSAAVADKGLFEKIDYSIYKKEELDGIIDYTRDEYGVGVTVYSYVMAYNTEKYPASKPRPTNWSEFWDVDKYPGIRSLVSGQYGTEGPWEEALMADGVAPGAIYPMDIDRVFASLDKVKPHIRKWWGGGSEIQQMMHDKAVDVAQSYDGRANTLIGQGAPIEINWHQSKWTWDLWRIPKGSPNVASAQKFIEFATRAEQQAALAKLFPTSPTNQGAFKYMPAEVGRKLASYPENLAKGIPLNIKWYAEAGANGLTGRDRLIQRWNEWILQ
ncbi:ABC transporter substrate-binding protein [Mesorhizobium sp. M0871]